MSRPRPVVFLDRDGTIIADMHYIARPEEVALIPGVAPAIRRLNQAGWAVVVITNQSGIARGKLTEADYEQVRARLDALLDEQGALIDRSYHCPHHPDVGGPCDCRKPGTKLHLLALRDLALDRRRTVCVGDRWRDVKPAFALEGRGILVPGPESPPDEVERAQRELATASSLGVAVDRILGAS
ncbi:MAG: HAD-IIIA family hydrolase [Gemmatimonadetes bacterium]|nr:HAD-IIIA family hydrolase [Gemmatimonadota bacterium]